LPLLRIKADDDDSIFFLVGELFVALANAEIGITCDRTFVAA
jgi:hypothetical protein